MSCCSKKHPIIQELGSCDRRLPVIQLRTPDLAVRVDERLLIDAPDALQRPHREGVLSAAIAGTLALEVPVRVLSAFAFSKAATWASVNTNPSGSIFASSAVNRFRMV